MKIFTIELSNYRQYRRVKLDLSTDEKHNFTIIQGPNGAGKTNLMNAITWCLYGKEPHLSSDSTSFGRANAAAFGELKLEDTLAVKVAITLGDAKPEYYFSRQEDYWKHGKKPEDVIVNEKRTVMYLDHYDWKNHMQPTYLLNRILPESVSGFFFFDGEMLDEFFRAESAERVREALLDVSQITLLDKALDRLDGMKDDLRRSARGLNSQADQIQEQIESTKKELTEHQKHLRDLEGDKSETLKHISQIDEKLRNSPRENVQELQKERDGLSLELKDLEEEKSQAEEQLNEAIIDFGPIIYSKSALDSAFSEIEKRYKSGELPPKIQEQYLNDLLKQGQCICGTDISIPGPPRQNVEKKLHASLFSEIDEEIRNGKFELGTLRGRLPQFLKLSDDLRSRIVKRSEKIRLKQERLKEISEVLDKYDLEEIQRLESDRIKLAEQKDKLNQEIGLARGEVDRRKSGITSLETQYKNELKKGARHTAIEKEVDLCEKAIKSMESIKEDIITEIRKIIEAKTKQYFLSLIWKKGTFVDVRIDADYSLSVVHKGGWNARGILSAGEGQMLALSFMAALKEVSGFHFPVVIDTPLGRISKEPKDNVADSLPHYLEGTQVTMLMTDQEYTESVRTRMKPRVGKEFSLDYEEASDETKVTKYAN